MLKGNAMLQLLAISSSTYSTCLLLISAILAACLGWLTWQLVRANSTSDAQTKEWDDNGQRLVKVRENSWLFKTFEPLLTELGRHPQFKRGIARLELHRLLARAGLPLRWFTPEQYVGVLIVQAILVGVTLTVVAQFVLSAFFAVTLGLMALVLFLVMSLKHLRDVAAARVRRIKLRMPFALDLIGLLVDSGAPLRQSIDAVATENLGHPLGDEFDEVARSMERGRTFRESMEELSDRIDDVDIDEFVTSVLMAEELGVEISKRILEMADQMRLKRSQLVEKALGEAEAKMPWPSLAFALACLTTFAAPFAIHALQHSMF
jgi:tight adherence protein C